MAATLIRGEGVRPSFRGLFVMISVFKRCLLRLGVVVCIHEHPAPWDNRGVVVIDWVGIMVWHVAFV